MRKPGTIVRPGLTVQRAQLLQRLADSVPPGLAADGELAPALAFIRQLAAWRLAPATIERREELNAVVKASPSQAARYTGKGRGRRKRDRTAVDPLI